MKKILAITILGMLFNNTSFALSTDRANYEYEVCREGMLANGNTPRSVRGKNKWPGMHQVWRTKFHLPKARYVIGMEFVHKCTQYCLS